MPISLQRKEPSCLLNNATGNLREEMSENSAFQEDRFDSRSNLINQGDVMMRQDTREDKDKATVRGSLRRTEKDVQIFGSSGSDTSPMRGKNFVDQMDNGEFLKPNESIKESVVVGDQEEEKVETVQSEEKQQRKRKRTIMNDKQMSLIERALLDETDMQRNTSSIRLWADRLSHHGSEVTSSQLKNWLNNRKARLARASKEARAPPEADNSFLGKQSGPLLRHSHGLPDDPGEEHLPSNARGAGSSSRTGTGDNSEALAKFVQHRLGQYVMLVDAQGEEIGTGGVHQVYGKWNGKSLDESGTCSGCD